MKTIDRITFDPEVMGGKPCIRGMRVTAGTVVGLLAAGRARDEILKLYPYLDDEDITQALAKRQHPDGSFANVANWMEADPNLVTGYALMALSYCRPR